MALLLFAIFASCECSGVHPVDTPVYVFDDVDAGVRCYGAPEHRWSCVKVTP